ATASIWPGEADARFLVALEDVPEREGRATVFGRLVEGWPTLAAIARAPVDKSHRPVEPVLVRAVRRLDPDEASEDSRGGARRKNDQEGDA
ncbi:MAG: peptidylprolyl isomerase, partial [Acidobacteriota bacterium]